MGQFHQSKFFALIVCSGFLVLVSLYSQLNPRLGRCEVSSHAAQPSSAPQTATYHEQLSRIRPDDTAPHSKTLAVASRIYVINLARRRDRYLDMLKLERALDLQFTWHNATDSHDGVVQTILERLRWWRNENRINQSDPKADPSPYRFKWADDISQDRGPLGVSSSDWWSVPVEQSHLPPLPPPPSPDTRAPVATVFGENGDAFTDDHVSVSQVACWHSHYGVLRKIAEGDDEVAIVFEDDIDLEWDTAKQLRAMWNVLPPEWDVVMIGHCGAEEWTHPALRGNPKIRPAHHTLCTHAYAVTRRAAQRWVRHLRSEGFAYSRPFDHTLIHLYYSHKLVLYSVYPSIIVQTYESKTDIAIAGGNGGVRVQWLEDSTRERIALAEKASASATNSSTT